MKSNNLKVMAQSYRLDGKSLKEISNLLDISKSTASLWLSDMPLPDVEDRRNYGRRKGTLSHKQKCLELRKQYQFSGRELAKKGDIEHLKGCMLYWAEGTKCKNSARMANTDSDIVLCFRNFVSKYFNVNDVDFAICINCYLGDKVKQNDVEEYWTKLLHLPSTCVKKGVYKLELDKDVTWRKNRHTYGVCTLSIARTDVVQSIFGSIQEYVGIDRPEWLL